MPFVTVPERFCRASTAVIRFRRETNTVPLHLYIEAIRQYITFGTSLCRIFASDCWRSRPTYRNTKVHIGHDAENKKQKNFTLRVIDVITVPVTISLIACLCLTERNFDSGMNKNVNHCVATEGRFFWGIIPQPKQPALTDYKSA